MKIFLSTSFSTKIDANGRVLQKHRQKIEGIIQIYEAEGHAVFCAVRDENWQIADKDPTAALKFDITHIDTSDQVVAVLEDELSAGVQLEIGYALAQHKKNVLLSEPGAKLGWTNAAVAKLPGVTHRQIAA